MSSEFDVLGIGCIAVDDVLEVASLPHDDEKLPVTSRTRAGGGTTANAVVAAAKIGVKTAFAGTLGTDDVSLFATGDLTRRGVDTRWIRRDVKAAPIRTTILSLPSGTRSVLYELARARGGEDDWPPEEAIASATCLLIDHFGMTGMIRAAKLARAHNRVVIADIEDTQRPEFEELLAHIDYLFIPSAICTKQLGFHNPVSASLALAAKVRNAVILTSGEHGLWLARHGTKQAHHLPAERVDTLETIGCGDVLRGVFAGYLARGADVDIALAQAMKAATIKATRTGGRDSYPSFLELEPIAVAADSQETSHG